ncbi:MAG: polyhydroxyalkanoate synthesis repressor PhaR [Alphaproteobacteria bacterium]|nr:polyhydroxyalkanoate synthesis repressor PhaR [Alphaproteobacteria bacterium]
MANSGKAARTARGAGATPLDDGDATPSATIIKKYANRRLYNTASSSYVTLDHLCQMVKDGEEFVVYDARTGEDITRSVLTQIIVEEEAKGQNLLPIAFLRQLIRFYGDSLQLVVPGYLEHAMAAFAENQERTRSQMKTAFGGLLPFAQFEDMSRQNMAMFEQALNMFTAGGTPSPAPASDAIDAMQQQLDALQRQLRALSGGGKPDGS